MGVCLPEKKREDIIMNQNKAKILRILSQDSTNSTTVSGSNNPSRFNSLTENNKISNITRSENIEKFYRIERRPFAFGGTGIVFEACDLSAEDEETGRKYAVKVVKKRDDKFNLALKREIEINSVLCHEGIVKCYEIFENANAVFFVEEKIEGGDLFEYIVKQPNKHLQESEAIDIFEQILLILTYARELPPRQKHLKQRDKSKINGFRYL